MTLKWHWIAVFAVFVACIPLFAWNHQFFGDWPNHVAMFGYFGEYLRTHGSLAAVFHTNDTVGRATPLFYNNLSLPALGALSAVVGPRVALTAAVAALLLLQFASVRALFLDATHDEGIACAAGVIVTWAIYPLTDLYNRAAIPEFFAITALQAGSCLWAFYARDPARREHASVAAGLLVTIAAGVHPPTALFGGLTFGVLWLASLVWCPDRRRVVLRTGLIAAGTAGVLAPWLYVLSRFGQDLKIVRQNGPLMFFPTSLDAVATRLSAVPTLGADPSGIGTPALDAQVSVPLGAACVLLTIAALAARARDPGARRAFVFAVVCAAATAVLFRLSTSAPAWESLPKALTVIQFPYRLVAFVNLAALGALTGVLAALARDGIPLRSARRVLAAGVIFATVAVGLKLPRCLESNSLEGIVADYVNPPNEMYFGHDDYATPDAFAQVDAAAPRQAVRLPVAAAPEFAVVHPAHVSLTARTQVTTNVQAFPWNVLTVDGRPVPRAGMLVEAGRLGAWLEAGEHDVGYQFRPDRAWSALRALSLALLALWACAGALGPRRPLRALAGARRRLRAWREPRSTPTSSASA
jgi:hypothetical protein